MRKKVASGLALVMAVSMLTACGGQSGQTENTTAGTAAAEQKPESAQSNGGSEDSTQLIMTWWGNQVRNERTQKVIEMYCEENPGIEIDGQFSEWSDYWNKLATSAAGHTMPDIISMDYNYLNQYVKNGLLCDLTSYVENGVIDMSDCTEGSVNTGKVDGAIYAIGAGMNAPALLYNKTLLEENNIAIKDYMNMEEFIALCKEVYEKTGYKTNFNYGNDESYFEYYLRSKDVCLFEEGKLGGDSADPYISFFKLFEDGIKEGWHIDPAVFAERTIGASEQDPLVYGSSPETRSWCAFKLSNQYNAYQNAAPDGMEVGLTTWPSSDVKKSNYLKTGLFLCVSPESKNQDEAAKFINFFVNSVECNNVLLAERGIPLPANVANAIAPNLDEGNQKILKYINEVAVPVSSQINPPAPDGASEIKDLLNKLEEQVCYGQMSAEEAGTQMFEQGNAIMAKKAQ